MKRNVLQFLCFICMFMFMGVLSSCTKQDDLGQDVIDDYQTLTELKALNDSLLTNAIHTRISGLHLLHIVLEDAMGAYEGAREGARIGAWVGSFFGNPVAGSTAGAIFCGIGYGAFRSYGAYEMFAYAVQLEDDVDANSVYESVKSAYLTYCADSTGVFTAPDLYENEFGGDLGIDPEGLENIDLDSLSMGVGRGHNIILASLQNRIPSGDTTVVTRANGDGSVTDHGEDPPTDGQVIESLEMREGFIELIESKQASRNTLPDEIMNLYGNLLQDYVSGCSDIRYIINQYAAVINSSTEMTEEDKQYLKMGLATSYYSYLYWIEPNSQSSHE